MPPKIPEIIMMDMVKMFENPKKQYIKFCKDIRQDIETKSFKTFTSRLNCFIDMLCSDDISKETATMKIEEFVNQGMVEIMLWDAFVNLISQPVSPTITNALVALLQTLCNITDNSISAAKEQVCVFLPYLLRDVISNEKNEHRLRIEGTKLINHLLEQNPIELREQIEKLKNQRTIREDVGTLITNAADFELQAQVLEMVFRLVPASERIECVSSWFENEDLQNLFLNIEDKAFEAGCRKFLNKTNENKKGVFSIPCQMVLFGSQQIPLAKDVGSGNHWLDFNLGSKTLKFFFEEKEDIPSEDEDDDIWWRTVTIELDNVVDCKLLEQEDAIILKITLKDNVTSLVPSWSPTDVRVIQIKFGSDCDVDKLREVLERFSWIRPDRFSSSPKASVSIFSVHLADRQKGQMTVVPTMDSKPPEVLVEEDSIEDEVLVNHSDITVSLDDKGMEESEELLPALDKPQEQLDKTKPESQVYPVEKTDDLQPTDSQELKADYSSRDVNDIVDQRSLRSSNTKTAEDNLEQNQKTIDKDDIGRSTNPVGENDDLNKAQDAIEDEHNEKNIGEEKQKRKARDKNTKASASIPPKKTSHSNDESESGTESCASTRSSRRSPRGRASSKRTNSPLPVEIIKSDRRKSTSSSDKSSTDSENEKNDSLEPKKLKTYPSAFNVAKRMEAKKNTMLTNNSQEIKKKVFGQRGSSFGQKTSLHIMAPARRSDHFKGRKPAALQDKQPSKKHFQNKDTRTKKQATEQENSDSDHTTKEDNEKEVIQDSFPIDDSPEEPGPKAKHSLVPCKSVREKRIPRDTAAFQQGRKKRASVSPGLSAITEEKSPVDIPLVKKTPQATRAPAKDKPAESSESRTKKRGREVEAFGDNEKAQESGNTSEDTLLYEAASKRKTRSNAKTSDQSKASRSNKVDSAKERNKHSTKLKEKQDKIDFEREFDFDLPDLTVMPAEKPLVGEGEKLGQESAALPSNTFSFEDNRKSRDKSAADEKGMPLDDDDEDDVVYMPFQEYTMAETRDKPQDTSSGKTGDRERIEEDFDSVLYQEDSTDKKKSKPFENSKSRNLRKKKENSKQLRQRLSKRGFSEDDLDEDSDLPNEYKSPKRRKTYGKNQTQKYSSKLEENWTKDTDKENKKRTTDVPRMGWQISSKEGTSKSIQLKSSPRPSNKSDEEFQSGYESDDRDRDPPEYHQRYTEAYSNKRQAARNPQSRKGKGEQLESKKQSKSVSKPKNRVEDMEEEDDDDEETNEVLKLRRFCQDITASKSSTPASELPLRKRRDEETEDGKPAKKLKDSKIQSKYNEQMSDKSGKNSPKHLKHHGKNVETFADHSVPRSRLNMNESRFGPRQVNTSKYETPRTTPGRLNDSGLGRSIGTGSRKRTSVTSSTASTTPKGRKKGELRVTTSISKTPITPRTSAIMKRIDEEEDFGHSKKPRQIFVDWTSSGPSRTVSTPYQDPYSPEINNDDHQDREQKRAHERLIGKGDHNPNIKPRQLFRQVVNEHSPEEELEEETLYDQSSSYEDMRDISDMLSGLGGNLTERLRRKRHNLQRFCKRTMDVTIETINRHFEQNLSNRDKIIDSFNDQFLEEIKILKDEMDKAKKTEEQILARIEEDIKILKTRRILQENKIKGLRNLCVEFQNEMIKGSDSQPDHQDAFQDEIRQELTHIQQHFLLEAQKQDRENLRRSLRSVLDATTM
ncbi:synaptonemal complex protein 2-like [Actinia tenebrosa]|uniref:Synaptonemal complex protein 2-like n=1 Tax=Actinia tenebrosa TaxID=6105 RepID=A0A6P8I727_ACTTE|nr:synaptonemal complex protein 2-like [Actinia tenebrosa]